MWPPFPVCSSIRGVVWLAVLREQLNIPPAGGEYPGCTSGRVIDLTDAAHRILIGMDNVSDGLVVYEKRIDAHNREELPFMITENIIMKLVAAGQSRQEAHEEIRVLSHQASAVVKQEGGKNDLVERIKRTEFFRPVWDDIDAVMDPKLYVGRAPELVERFVGKGGPVERRLAPYMTAILGSNTAQLNV